MRKITYTNSINGLSAEFSSDDPLMHLDLKNFDGCSVGANSVVYKPVEFDGQRVVSTNLSVRTIILPIQFTAKSNGRYSRAAALDKWTEILKTFVPLHSGTLTWTDGTKSRRITCRTLETPQITEILPYLFSAQIQLVADYPYWESTIEHIVTLEAGSGQTHPTVTNSCALTLGESKPKLLDGYQKKNGATQRTVQRDKADTAAYTTAINFRDGGFDLTFDVSGKSVTNEFRVAEDSAGNITSITNDTAERTIKVTYD